ncbi:tax1-binding protein 3 [Kryptolebias marmoratus]|uniref:Tax1-binding protein 3 n=1 Tax=Kryptolebias marmoratus TaxID=37003 RepID=A0A3Q3BKV4_KRYMA|nr:tax1-binding protein 3 [Kryptolebias marmoratus]
MSFVPGQPVTAVVQRIEIQKLRQGDKLILGFSIGGGIDQDPGQNPFSEDKTDKGIYVTRISPGGPADVANLRMGDKIMQVNGWDMTMVTHDQARKKLTKQKEDVVRLLITRKSLEETVSQSKGKNPKPCTYANEKQNLNDVMYTNNVR